MDLPDHTAAFNRRDTLAMTYGAKAIIPLEANFPMLRMSSFTPSSNDELLGKSQTFRV